MAGTLHIAHERHTGAQCAIFIRPPRCHLSKKLKEYICILKYGIFMHWCVAFCAASLCRNYPCHRERESSRGCSSNRSNSIPASKIHIKYEFIRRKICAYVLYVCCVYATLAAIYAYIFPRRIRIHIPCCLLHTCIFVYVLIFTFFCTLRI